MPEREAWFIPEKSSETKFYSQGKNHFICCQFGDVIVAAAITIGADAKVIAQTRMAVGGIEIVKKLTETTMTDWVGVGLWDNAFREGNFDGQGPGTLMNMNDDENPHNFVGQDSRRFYFRVTDPTANKDKTKKDKIPIKWFTEHIDGTDDDHPTNAELTLTETEDDSGVFVSRAVMLVADEVDRDQPTNTGIKEYGEKEAAYNEKDHRTRLVTPDKNGSIIKGRVVAQYTSNSNKTIMEQDVFVFKPSEWKRLNVHLVNVSSSENGAGILPTNQIKPITTAFKNIYAVCGVDVSVDVISLTNPPATCLGWGAVGGIDPAVIYSKYAGFNDSKASSEMDLVNVVKSSLGGSYKENDIYIICVAHIYDKSQGGASLSETLAEAFIDADAKTDEQLKRKGFAFVSFFADRNNDNDKRTKGAIYVHEATHITTDLENNLGGHYVTNNTYIYYKNLMMDQAFSGENSITYPRRLWDTDVANSPAEPSFIPAQITKIRQSRFVK